MAEPTLYLFDGYNLLHAGSFGDRDELVDTLASFVAGRGVRVILAGTDIEVPEVARYPRTATSCARIMRDESEPLPD